MPAKSEIEDLDSKAQLETDVHVENADAEIAKSKYKANKQLDQAAELLAQAGPLDFSKEDKKRVLKWIDFYVCVPMCLVYWIQQVSISWNGESRWTGN